VEHDQRVQVGERTESSRGAHHEAAAADGERSGAEREDKRIYDTPEELRVGKNSTMMIKHEGARFAGCGGQTEVALDERNRQRHRHHSEHNCEHGTSSRVGSSVRQEWRAGPYGRWPYFLPVRTKPYGCRVTFRVAKLDSLASRVLTQRARVA
jgi:hypothetical protein